MSDKKLKTPSLLTSTIYRVVKSDKEVMVLANNEEEAKKKAEEGGYELASDKDYQKYLEESKAQKEETDKNSKAK